MRHNEISGVIVDAAIHIHRRLGPGLLESVYQSVLAFELRKRGLKVAREVGVPIVWEDVKIDAGFRVDLMVEDAVVIELKSVETVTNVHKKQLLTYLRLAGKRLGLLINFGDETLRRGITRIVNGLEE